MRLLGFLLLIFPLEAQAGPWARGDDASFQTIKILGTENIFSLVYYAEFGITDRITLFATSDTRYPIEGTPPATLGGEYMLTSGGATYPISIGVKAQLPENIITWDEALSETRLAPTIAVGTGFETPFGHSWVTADAAFGFLTNGEHSFSQANIQIGAEPFQNTMVMLRGSYYAQDSYLKNALSASSAVRITETLHLFAEFEWVVTNPHENQLAVGLWLTR